MFPVTLAPPGKIGAIQEVRRKDEEEHRNKIKERTFSVVLLAYRCLDHIVMDCHNQHLHNA